SRAGTMVASIRCGPDLRATMTKMASFEGSPWCTAGMTFLRGVAQKKRRAGAGRRDEPLLPQRGVAPKGSLQPYRSRAPIARPSTSPSPAWAGVRLDQETEDLTDGPLGA